MLILLFVKTVLPDLSGGHKCVCSPTFPLPKHFRERENADKKYRAVLFLSLPLMFQSGNWDVLSLFSARFLRGAKHRVPQCAVTAEFIIFSTPVHKRQCASIATHILDKLGGRTASMNDNKYCKIFELRTAAEGIPVSITIKNRERI